MRNDPELTKTIEKGSILQVDPAAVLGFEAAGRLAIVVNKHGWGVDANIVGEEGTRALAWPIIEPTGGTLIWEKDGTRLVPEKAPRHHP